jgi:hypothetical protein
VHTVITATVQTHVMQQLRDELDVYTVNDRLN